MSDNDNTTASSASTTSTQVSFPRGIPGFEDQTRYLLYHSDTPSGRVYWMESCDHPEITFTLVDPKSYGLNYVLELTADEQALLQAENADDIAVLLMLSKAQDSTQEGRPALNANIGGPILVNVEKRLGMQKLLAHWKTELNIIQ